MNQDFLFFMTNLQVIMYSQINKDSENDPQHIRTHTHTHT